MTWHFAIGCSVPELWTDEVWKSKLHPSFAAPFGVLLGSARYFWKVLKCIHKMEHTVDAMDYNFVGSKKVFYKCVVY